MNTRTTGLEVAAPFSLKAVVLSHGWHECAPTSWSEGGQCFQLIEREGRSVPRVSVVQANSRKRSVLLRIPVSGEGGSATTTAEIRPAATRTNLR